MHTLAKHSSAETMQVRGLSLERKTQAGFACALICLGVIGFVSYFGVTRLREAAEWSRHSEKVISALHLLNGNISATESALRGYIITGDDGFLDIYHGAQRDTGADLLSVRRFTADNQAQQRRLDVLDPLVAKRMAGLDEEIEARRRQGIAAAPATTMLGVGNPLADQIRRSVAELETVEQDLSQQRDDKAKRIGELAKAVIVVGNLLALTVIAVALFAVGKDFDRRRAYLAQASLAARLARLGGWEIRLPGYKITWSDEICVIHEVPPGFVPTMEEGINFYAPESRGAIRSAIEACARDGTPFDLELQIITAKGRHAWVRAIGVAERDAKGVIGRLQGALQDITARKGAERELQSSEARYRSLFEDAPDGIVVADPGGTYLDANARICRMLGYTRDELIGRNAADIVVPEETQHIGPALSAIKATSDYHREWRFRRKDGSVLVAEVIGCLMPDGNLLGMIRDISVRKQVQEALHESEAQFRQVVENIDEVFWIMDSAKNVMLYVSPAYEGIWGRTCESLLADQGTWLESVHPEERERVGQARAARYTSGGYDETFRIIRPDGTLRWIHSRAFPVFDQTGKAHRVVGVSEDITKYRTMEEQFRQAQKLEAIGTLAGGIAHDFNNILAAINGYTELALLSMREDPDARESLDAVLKASGRAADLIHQILMFSRQQPLERRPILLHSVAAECIALLRATLPATIEFDTALAADAPMVLADPTQIHQILMNLGTNAWHAMKEHPGRLQVKLEKCVVDAAYAATHPQLRVGVYARLSVSDTGSGMDQAMLGRIFEPFFTTKPIGEGTGLGLAVVHGIMNSHDGVITVYSQPGEGTVFHLYFPAHHGEPAPSTIAEDTTPHGHGERVLFVDDEALLARLGQKTLAALGYEVESTTQPSAALALVRADPSRFALVVTDQTMPEMTGLTLATHLREVQPGLPVILMTGYALSLTPARLAAAGIHQLLHKPTTLHSLAMAVNTALYAEVLSQ